MHGEEEGGGAWKSGYCSAAKPSPPVTTQQILHPPGLNPVEYIPEFSLFKSKAFNNMLMNVKVTDRRFQLPLSLFCLLTLHLLLFHFFLCVFLLTLSVVLSDTVAWDLQKQPAHSHLFHLWLRRILLLTSDGFSRLYKLGSSHFLCLHSWKRFSVCLWKQTDSEQTDFAFDGEMTATEVCTPASCLRHEGHTDWEEKENDSGL